MPFYSGLAIETFRHDLELTMLSAIARAGMADMQVAFIDEFDQRGLQYGKTIANLFLEVHAGKVLRNGLMVTCAYTPAST